MEFDYRNLRVFISSKMAELAPERKAVQEALTDLLISPFVFEADAGARETTIEQTFLEELQQADLYIGLFWQGYGEYTIQEYETAGQHRIDRLVFEKRLDLDQRDPRLQDFLNQLGQVQAGVTIRWFNTPDELRRFVKEAVQKWQAGKARKARAEESLAIQPEQLPCLCDRELQEQKFQTSLLPNLREKRRRPLVLVVHGHEQEGHRLYIDRIRIQSLLAVLTMANARGRGRVARINDALSANQSQQEFCTNLRIALANELQIAYQEDDQFLVEFARRHQLKALVLVLSVRSSEQAHQPGNLLEKTCAYLAEFPDLPEGLLLSFIVCFEYEESDQREETEGGWRRLFRWRSRRTTANGDDLLREELRSCREKYHNDTRLYFVELPPLVSPTPDHVFRWLEDEHVKEYLPVVPRSQVIELFAGQKSLPMEDLYEKLLDLLPS